MTSRALLTSIMEVYHELHMQECQKQSLNPSHVRGLTLLFTELMQLSDQKQRVISLASRARHCSYKLEAAKSTRPCLERIDEIISHLDNSIQ